MKTPVGFKSQNSDGLINKYASSSLLTTICADYVVAVISNFQMIVPTVNGKTIKIMLINLKTNVFFLLMPLSVKIRPCYLT